MKSLFFRSAIRGILVAIICWGVMLAVFALIALRFDDPTKLSAILASAALFVGATVAGRAASFDADSRLITASLCGLMIALPVLLCSIILSAWSAPSLLRLVITVICAAIGFLSKNSTPTSRSSIKRRKAIAKKYA